MRRWGRWSAIMALLMAVGAPPVIAQSPEPSASAIASPAASPRAPAASPADCADLEGLLPTSLGEGQELSAEVDVGVDGFDPDDMLDPFLGSLGLDRDDVCSVGIRYGPTTTDHIGLLVRVRGAGPGLAGRLAAALAERLREYGNQVTEEPVGLPTGPATQLRIVATGEETLLFVADAWAGSALLTPSTSLLGALLPRAAASSVTPASPEG